jgi:glycerol-3-phosphate dehydrogenase (NAD(P)+)
MSITDTDAQATLAIVGAGAWGTTLAISYARHGRQVVLLTRDAAQARQLRDERVNARYLPRVRIPRSVAVTADPATLGEAELVLFVTPSQQVRAAARQMAAHLRADALLVSCAKGFERDTLRRMTETLTEAAGARPERVCAWSGPNLAGEIADGLPASAVLACGSQETATAAQRALALPALRLYTSDDVVGVEYGGALKNVVAIAAGIADGMQLGQNAKAALLTRGLAEISRLGVAAGAQPLTFAGLSGLGDLIATCESPLSRNRSYGERIGRGATPDEAAAGAAHVIEGIEATGAAVALGQRYAVATPIADALAAVLRGALEPRAALATLLARDVRPERDA